MKKFLLLILLVATPANAALSVVQHVNCSTNANQATVVCNAGSGLSTIGVGHLIVIGYGGTAGGALTTNPVTGVTDNGGTPNTYTAVTGAAANSAGIAKINTDIWIAINSLSGATSITLTVTTANTAEKNMEVWEVAGAATSSVNDGNGTNVTLQTDNTSSPNGAPVTTTNANDFVAAVFIDALNSVTVNPHSGNEFTAGGDISSVSNTGNISLITASATTHTPQWDIGGTGGLGTGSTAAFKAASAGGSPKGNGLITLGIGP